jgi:hypothetical protein
MDWFATGVKITIITAVEIGEPNASDNKMLATTAENSKIAEISGDKANSPRKNLISQSPKNRAERRPPALRIP